MALLRLLSFVVLGGCAFVAHALIPFTGASGVSASAGSLHGCAIAGGALKCWGSNASGQLGDGTINQALVPVQVSGLSSGVIAVAPGNLHTCAITTGGAVKCWGLNVNG